MVFYGQWPRVLDGKGRITVPERFIQELGREILIIQEGGCFLVYPGKKIEEFPPQKMKNLWLVSVDESGRILIPQNIRKTILNGCQEVVWEGWEDHFKVKPSGNKTKKRS